MWSVIFLLFFWTKYIFFTCFKTCFKQDLYKLYKTIFFSIILWHLNITSWFRVISAKRLWTIHKFCIKPEKPKTDPQHSFNIGSCIYLWRIFLSTKEKGFTCFCAMEERRQKMFQFTAWHRYCWKRVFLRNWKNSFRRSRKISQFHSNKLRNFLEIKILPLGVYFLPFLPPFRFTFPNHRHRTWDEPWHRKISAAVI